MMWCHSTTPKAGPHYPNIPKKLCGYFTGDIGAINQLIHLWKFDDDADRRAFWAGVYADCFAGSFTNEGTGMSLEGVFNEGFMTTSYDSVVNWG